MRSRSREASQFFLILAGVFGAAVRLYPVLKADFPLVDGGMFYTMIRDLQAANYSLPVFTSYNHAQIAYAYPPLGFYLAGLINSLGGLSLPSTLHGLPVLFNIAVLPLFYLFIKEVSGSESKSALATLLFVLIPNSYWWSIVGGGLTRSLGTFFFMATLWSVVKLFQRTSMPWVALTSLLGAGTVLSHLTWALQTLPAIGLLWYFLGREKQNSKNLFIAGVGVLLLTSPWWATVISRHGIDVFAQAFQVNHSRWQAWTMLFALSFTGEARPVLAVFALVGLFIHISKRDIFFVLWALLCLLVDPRGGTFASVFPFALLAASAITDGVAPQLTRTNDWESSLQTRTGKMFFAFFVILFLYNAYTISDDLSREVLTSEQRNALAWVKDHTDETAIFLVFDDQGNPLLSPLVEWFPALSERRNLTTIQGTEWLNGDQHYNRQMTLITNTRQCLLRDMNCVRKATANATVDYILVSAQAQTPLLSTLENDPQFISAYSTESIYIFQFKK